MKIRESNEIIDSELNNIFGIQPIVLNNKDKFNTFVLRTKIEEMPNIKVSIDKIENDGMNEQVVVQRVTYTRKDIDDYIKNSKNKLSEPSTKKDFLKEVNAGENMITNAELVNYLLKKLSSSLIPSDVMDFSDFETSNDQHFENQEKLTQIKTILTKILSNANQLAISTRRGPGNFIITSPTTSTLLQLLPNFVYEPLSEDSSAKTLIKIGSLLDGRIGVYVNRMSLDNNILVGYKGSGDFDCGAVLHYPIKYTIFNALSKINLLKKLFKSFNVKLVSGPLLIDDVLNFKLTTDAYVGDYYRTIELTGIGNLL